MTAPAADNLRPLADPRYGLARGFDDAQQTIQQAADLLDAIDALHQPDDEPFVIYEPDESRSIWVCVACATEWPCPTARLLHPEATK